MATVLFLVAAATSHLPASNQVHHNFWWSCKTPERTHCVSHEMPLQHRKPVGYWQAEKGTRTVVYPYWKHQVRRIVRSAYRQVTRAVRIAVHGAFYPVTGYSWGCGTPNGIMASNLVPYVGAVANDTLPFGTRIYIPSLGYSGVVEDRGVGTGGFDLFMPSCQSTYAVTGYREVIIG